MSILDIIVVVILVIAAIMGWRSGLTKQLFSLAGIILGIILANRLGFMIGSFIGVQPPWASLVGFIVVFIVVLVLVALLGMLCKKLFHMAGLKVVDNILGVVLSCAKYIIIMAILLSLFAPINDVVQFVPKSKLDSSLTYNKIIAIGKLFIPSVEWMDIRFESHTNSSSIDV
ncbi:MAG: CvpA family protein [Rikenellaceae bacterium]